MDSAPETLLIDLQHDHQNVSVSAQLDGDFIGTISLELPVDVTPLETQEAALIAGCVAVVIGQLCMAKHLILQFPLENETLKQISALADICYGAHAFLQKKALLRPTLSSTVQSSPRRVLPISSHNNRAVLLWSGGKDALAALKILRKNGFDVVGLHGTANVDCREAELNSAVLLGKKYGLPVVGANIEWDVLRQLGQRFSSAFSVFPLRNAIPHGRDLVLLALAAAVARRSGAQFICAGFERDLWVKSVQWDGHDVWRHDVQSRHAGQVMAKLFEREAGVHFFSPLAGVSEFSIFDMLLKSDLDDWQNITSCFWGGWCGQCSKCLRYALTQKVLGCSIIPFQVFPLQIGSPAFTSLLQGISDQSCPYWEEQIYCLWHQASQNSLEQSGRVLEVVSASLQKYGVSAQAVLEYLKHTSSNLLAPEGFSWAC